jgi:hypothetical protein
MKTPNPEHDRRPDDGLIDQVAIRVALTGCYPHVAKNLTTRELWEAVRLSEQRGMTLPETAAALLICVRHVDRIRPYLRDEQQLIAQLAALPDAQYQEAVDRCLRTSDHRDWMALTCRQLVDRTRRAAVRLLADVPRREAAVWSKCPTHEGRRRVLLAAVDVRRRRLERAVDVLNARRRDLAFHQELAVGVPLTSRRELAAAA